MKSSFGLPPAKRMRLNEQSTSMQEREQVEQGAKELAAAEEPEPTVQDAEEEVVMHEEQIEGTDYKFYVSP